jgi:Phage integrase SAM-like domain
LTAQGGRSATSPSSAAPGGSESATPALTRRRSGIKRESDTDRDRGELQERTTIGFLRYVDEWVERYRGQGRRGFRESTREEYRRLIRADAHPHFPRKLKLVDVSTYALARFMDWLADESEQGKRLGDRTIANAVIPLRAALATAKREGLIRHNPAQGLAMPHREQLPEEEVKVFSSAQLAVLLTMAPERHAPLFELLAATGLRISEAIALQRLHLQLDQSVPEVCIRRALGHHSPAFTLTRYTHLLPGDEAPALDLSVEVVERCQLSRSGTRVSGPRGADVSGSFSAADPDAYMPVAIAPLGQ